MGQRICSNCGHIENEYTYFCTECGAKTELLRDPSATDTRQSVSVEHNSKSESADSARHIEESNNFDISGQDNAINIDNIVKEDISNQDEDNFVKIYTDSSPKSVKRTDDSNNAKNPNNNQKRLIMLLSAVIGMLVVIIIGLAVSSRRQKNEEYAASTVGTEEVATAVNNNVEEYYEKDDSLSVENSGKDDLSDEADSSQIQDYENEDEEISSEDLEALGNLQETDDMQIVDDDGVHDYELIIEDCTWTEAFYNCIRRGGYLARITTDEEYQAILNQICSENKEKIMFWISGACEDGRFYHWVYPDGSFSTENVNDNEKYNMYWLNGEPSFYDNQTESYETKMNMFYVKSQDRWVWNDVPDDVLAVANFYSGSMGYICEHE